MANFSRQSKRRPLNLATRLTRFEQTDQSTFSSLQPDSLLFPYPLSTGKVRVFSYFSLPSGALPFTRAVQPRPEMFVAHQVSSGFVCEINTKPGAGILCYGERLVFYPKLVTMSPGGEEVSQVMGREESAEAAQIANGAFQFDDDRTCILNATLSNVASSTPWALPVLNSHCKPARRRRLEKKCSLKSDFDALVTIFVTRFEYTNLYHTATELAASISSLIRARQSGIFKRAGFGIDDEVLLAINDTTAIFSNVRLVFPDGHAKGSLDELWTGVFGGIQFVRAGLLNESPMCLGLVVFAEIGYSSFISMHLSDLKLVAMQENGYHQMCSYLPALVLGHLIAKRTATIDTTRVKGKGIFIMRDRPVLPAHPRVKASFMECQVDDEQSLQERVQLMRARGLDVSLAYLSKMLFARQVELIRSCDVVIGIHGAAFAHMIWADRNTFFVELAPNSKGSDVHFSKMALTKGQRHTRLGWESKTASWRKRRMK